MDSILHYCREQGITAGVFSGIGAMREIALNYYNLAEKKREGMHFAEPMEMVSLQGNIALLDNEVVLHAHGVFSNHNMEAKAGHVDEAIVHAACEIIIQKGTGVLKKSFDDYTGLNTFSL